MAEPPGRLDGRRGARFPAGAAFVVLALLSLFVPGQPPKADDPGASVVAYVTDKRSELLISSLLWFAAFVALLWFVAQLYAHLRAGGADTVELMVMLSGATSGAVFLTTSFCVMDALALAGPSDSNAAVAKIFYDLSGALFAMAGPPFILFFIGASLAGRQTATLPAWLCGFGLLAAAFQLPYTVNLATTHGPLATGGQLGFIEPVFSMGWILAAGIVIARSPTSKIRTIPSVK